LPRTERRWTRVDLSLVATLPYGSTAPIPERAVLGGWTAAVAEKADATFSHLVEKGGRIVSVLGGHGDLEMQAHSSPDGINQALTGSRRGVASATEVREKSRRRAGRQNGCRPAQRSSLPTTAATMSTGAQMRSRIMPLTGWSKSETSDGWTG
jgi:hypothetical protein